jgi:hypothetical protein
LRLKIITVCHLVIVFPSIREIALGLTLLVDVIIAREVVLGLVNGIVVQNVLIVLIRIPHLDLSLPVLVKPSIQRLFVIVLNGILNLRQLRVPSLLTLNVSSAMAHIMLATVTSRTPILGLLGVTLEVAVVVR